MKGEIQGAGNKGRNGKGASCQRRDTEEKSIGREKRAREAERRP